MPDFLFVFHGKQPCAATTNPAQLFTLYIELVPGMPLPSSLDQAPHAAIILVASKATGHNGDIIGYRAKKHVSRMDLEKRDYDPHSFWDPILYHPSCSLILDPDEFYILMTKEAIAVPPDYAAKMMPYDTRAGEFRVHYAGFLIQDLARIRRPSVSG